MAAVRWSSDVRPALARQVHGCALSVPGRALGGVIEGLKQGLPEGVHALLAGFHAGVVGYLKAGGGEGAAQQKELLDEQLLQLKAAVLGQQVSAEAG